MSFTRITLGLFAWLLLAHHVSAQQTYDVRLTYPRHVDQVYDIRSTVTQNHHISIAVNDVVAKEETNNTKLLFEAAIKVLAVNADQQTSAAEITIKEFTFSAGAEEEATIVFPAETAITATQSADGKVRFALGEVPVNPGAQQLLASLHLIDDGTSTSDKIFGTDQPVAIGETWGVNAEEALANAARGTGNITLEDIRGSMTLEGVEQRNGQRCLKVVGGMSIKNLNPDEIHKDLTVEHGTLKLQSTSYLPLDSDKGPLEQTGIITLKFTASNQNEQGVLVFTSDMIEKRSEIYTFQ